MSIRLSPSKQFFGHHFTRLFSSQNVYPGYPLLDNLERLPLTGHHYLWSGVVNICQIYREFSIHKLDPWVLDYKYSNYYLIILSCSEEFQGISFFYNYETQKLTRVFTCSVQINAALIVPFT